MNQEDDYITGKEAAELLGVNSKTLSRWSDRIPHERLPSGIRRYRRSQILAYRASNTHTPKPPLSRQEEKQGAQPVIEFGAAVLKAFDTPDGIGVSVPSTDQVAVQLGGYRIVLDAAVHGRTSIDVLRRLSAAFFGAAALLEHREQRLRTGAETQVGSAGRKGTDPAPSCW